jgi:hypothetical protein
MQLFRRVKTQAARHHFKDTSRCRSIAFLKDAG